MSRRTSRKTSRRKSSVRFVTGRRPAWSACPRPSSQARAAIAQAWGPAPCGRTGWLGGMLLKNGYSTRNNDTSTGKDARKERHRLSHTAQVRKERHRLSYTVGRHKAFWAVASHQSARSVVALSAVSALLSLPSPPKSAPCGRTGWLGAVLLKTVIPHGTTRAP